MYDELFSNKWKFTPVSGDPFATPGQSTAEPSIVQSIVHRPVTPTPDEVDVMLNKQYPAQPPLDLPNWLPSNVQNYMRSNPSYAEGQKQPSGRVTDEPWGQTTDPQMADIQRLFREHIMKNAPTSNALGGVGQYKQFFGMPGFAGFTGGDEI